MGRRAAETTNPVPALGVPLTRGRVVLEQKWGPLCSVGVQTSPGLCSLPSLKRRAQSGGPASTDTMSLDRVKPVNKQALQKCTSNVSQDDSSQGGIYCQIKSIRANPNWSGCRGNLKLTPRYTNGSVAAPELVGGVSSEGVETKEVDSQCQATGKGQKRGQSLRSERPHLAVQCGNSCTTPTRPCRPMMSPRLCSTCGRKQPQAPPSITPNKRPTSQIQASMTLPAPLKKDLPRLQKQPSADTPTTNTSKPSISTTQAQKTHDSKSQTRDNSAPETKVPVAEVTMEPTPNKTCKNTTATVCLCKKERKQTSSQHTQTHNTLTSMSKAESKATHQKQHTPQDGVRCTEECVNKQTHVAPVDKASTVHDSLKPPPPVLSIGTEFKATPTLSCKVSSHTKATEVTSQSISPYLFTGSKSTPQPKLSEQKMKAEPETKSHPKDLHLQKNDMLQIPQCNGVPEALHELLQGVEENLLSNQEKIKVLLNVIQDLEKSKALSEGRCSYRTGQDINNCMTCQKTACTIYSVEHDFRLQEMRLQSVLQALDVECEVSAPIPKPATSRPRTRDRVKKLHKKCFWWL